MLDILKYLLEKISAWEIFTVNDKEDISVIFYRIKSRIVCS